MDVLLIVQDPLLRDMIAVGLENVPGTAVVVAAGPSAIDRTRNKKFDVVFLAHNPKDKASTEEDAFETVARLREFDKESEAVVVTDARWMKILTEKRDQLAPCAFLRAPIQPNEFFRLAVRLRSRRAPSGRSRTGASR